MFETLQHIDQQLLLAINGWHCPFIDTFMWHVSKPYSWTLILLAAIFANLRVGWKQTATFAIAVVLAVLLADQISSTLIKNTVMRLRPTHDPALAHLVHIVRDYRGGMYGFVSSHAANAFAIAVLVGRMMPRRRALLALIAWACLQCYSRMYLGVHYPGDILGGMLVGVTVALMVFPLWRKAQRHYVDEYSLPFTPGDATLIAAAVATTVVTTILV